ncbi:MAG: ABC transporter substrate-binding protein [candidate division WOR-3 bacterium]
MNKRKIWLIVLAIIIIAVIFIGIYLTQKPSQKEQVIKIGAILPLTGNLSIIGVPEKQGIEMGVEKVNQDFKKIGVPLRLEVIFEDTQGDPKNAVSAAQKLLLQGVRIIIISTTGASRAIIPVAISFNVPVITLCMDPTIQQESPLVFRLYESMGQEAEVILSYFENKKNRQSVRVGVLYVNHAGAVQQLNDFFKPGFKSLGIDLVFEEPYQIGQKDFKDIAIKAKASRLTHLVVIGYGFEYPAIFRDFKNIGFKGQILGGWGFIAVETLSPEDREGVIVAAPAYLLGVSEMAKNFEEAFSLKYKNSPNFDAAFAYNAVLMLAQAVRQAYPDVRGETIAKMLSQLRTFNSIFGEINMTEDGDLSVPMTLAVWSKGRLVRYLPLTGGN